MAESKVSKAEEIVAVATALFAERGYEGVSVRDICSVMGGNCSIISYYFGGKAGLYREVMKRQFQAWEKVLDEAPLNGPDPKRDFEAVCQAALNLRRTLPSFSGLMMRESAFPGPIFLEIQQEHDNRYGARLTEMIRNGQRRGVFKSSVRAEQVAHSLTLLLKAPLGEARTNEEDFFETIKTVFLEGLMVAAKEGETGRVIGKQSAKPRGEFRR